MALRLVKKQFIRIPPPINYLTHCVVHPGLGYLYVVKDTWPPTIARCTVPDLTFVDTVELPDDGGYAMDACVDLDAKKAFYTINSNPGKLRRADLPSSIGDAVVSADVGVRDAYNCVVDPGTGYVYFSAGRFENTQRVYKVRIHDFVIVGSVAVPCPRWRTKGMCIDKTTAYHLYVISGEWNSMIYQIDLATFTVVKSITTTRYYTQMDKNPLSNLMYVLDYVNGIIDVYKVPELTLQFTITPPPGHVMRYIKIHKTMNFLVSCGCNTYMQCACLDLATHTWGEITDLDPERSGCGDHDCDDDKNIWYLITRGPSQRVFRADGVKKRRPDTLPLMGMH